MRFSYHSDTDSLYIHLSEQPGTDVYQVGEEIVLDLNEHGELVGIEVQNASRNADVSVLNIGSLPLKNVTFTPQQEP